MGDGVALDVLGIGLGAVGAVDGVVELPGKLLAFVGALGVEAELRERARFVPREAKTLAKVWELGFKLWIKD